MLVDTSLLIEQQKRNERADPVRKALASFRFRGASSYSRLEFKSAWIQRHAYIYSRCRTGEFASMADLTDRLARQLTHSANRAEVATLLEIMTTFFDLNSERLSPKAQLCRLKAHCRNAVLTSDEAWGLMVTGEFNGTGCARAAERVSVSKGGELNASIPRCRRDRIECRVHEFFGDNEATFDQLADYVDAHDDTSFQLKIMRDHIRQAQKDPTHLCERSCCAKLADAIIAVDGRSMDVFAANNPAEWTVLSRLLGKKLLNPVVVPSLAGKSRQDVGDDGRRSGGN